MKRAPWLRMSGSLRLQYIWTLRWPDVKYLPDLSDQHYDRFVFIRFSWAGNEKFKFVSFGSFFQTYWHPGLIDNYHNNYEFYTSRNVSLWDLFRLFESAQREIIIMQIRYTDFVTINPPNLLLHIHFWFTAIGMSLGLHQYLNHRIDIDTY